MRVFPSNRQTFGDLLFASLCLLISIFATIASAEQKSEDSLQPWQECETFLAPSPWQGGGWGVFAARPFQRGDIVEIAPLFIPIDMQDPSIVNSVLRDYIYAYPRLKEDGDLDKMAAVVYGSTMFCNHHPTNPNAAWINFGQESYPEFRDAAQTVGLMALRDIRAGEELFTSYGDQDDGGRQWFRDRGLTLMDIPSVMQLTPQELEQGAAQFCTKVHAGIGQTTWKERVAPTQPAHVPFSALDIARLAPIDVGVGGAIAKVDIRQGDNLEAVPVLVIAKKKVEGTALAPLVLYYNDLLPSHQSWIRELQESGHLQLQHQGDDTGWKRIDEFTGEWDQVALLPVAGRVALLSRSQKNFNCRLQLFPSGYSSVEEGNAGIALQIIATNNIRAGEELRLELPSSSATKEEKGLLEQELKRTGQPSSPSDLDGQNEL